MNFGRRVRKSLLVGTMLAMSFTCTGCAQIIVPIVVALVQAGIQAYAQNKANEAASEGDYSKATMIQAAGNAGSQVAGGVIQGLGSSMSNASASQQTAGSQGPQVQQQQTGTQQQQQQSFSLQGVGQNIGQSLGNAVTGGGQQQTGGTQVQPKAETGLAVTQSNQNLQKTWAAQEQESMAGYNAWKSQQAAQSNQNLQKTWAAQEQESMAEYNAWKAQQAAQSSTKAQQGWSQVEAQNMAEYNQWKASLPASQPANSAPQTVVNKPVATTSAGNNWLLNGIKWTGGKVYQAGQAVVGGVTGAVSGAWNGAVQGAKEPYQTQEESPNGI